MSVIITSEFELALESIRSGKNVLITGKAGTGKSTLLRNYLESNHQKNVLVTAPTGVAALNVDGFTIHRTFGLRPGLYPDDLKPGGKWHPGANTAAVLRTVDVLVIDEISMVRADLFDMVDLALRRIRKTDAPFGGVQLVLVGDLLQLPPVVTDYEAELFKTNWDSPYFFSSHCYPELEISNITLTTVWRQTDEEFIEVLNQVREGSLGKAALEVLNGQVDPAFKAPGDWVTLAAHRRTVEKINQERLNELDAPKLISIAEYSGQTDEKSFSGSSELHYAIGARVMTIINDGAGRFVNGSFGTVVSASPDSISVHLDHNDEVVTLGKHTWEVKQPSTASGSLSSESVGTIKQFPIILAWAITIHKSQGKTIPKLFINLTGGTATDGQFYVALSRGVSLENLKFSALVEERHIRANNWLVRRIRREITPKISPSRLVFLSFDGVRFGISDHVARIHAIILENGKVVANFGSWINPMSDLGEFGRKNAVPSGGLAMAPALGDFWPLLLRQAAGGIVIGDELPMLEHAVRHQEKGLKIALGTGYDISEFYVIPAGSNVMTRCESMVATFQQNPFPIDHGEIVPPTALETEGALFIPTWADQTPILLDPTRATDSDNAWAAFSGANVTVQDKGELEETAELLSAWAISRGFWNQELYEDVKARAFQVGLNSVNIEVPSENNQNISELLAPGTRIAFTGRNHLLGGPADDDRLKQLCADRELEYKTSVSKTKCDVLIAGDLASMSRKAQNAREYGKPIISQEDFEHWYANGPFSRQPSGSASDASILEVSAVENPVKLRKTESPSTSLAQDGALENSAYTWVKPDEFLERGTRVAFRGSTFVNGNLYSHGESLQTLCESLGLEYKQAVTKTRSDLLVTDDPHATDGKMGLALRYSKPLMHLSDFSAWASKKLESQTENTESIDTVHVEESLVDSRISIPSEQPVMAPVLEEPTEETIQDSSIPTLSNDTALDPTPQELMDRAHQHQAQVMQERMHSWSAPLPVSEPHIQHAESLPNKSVARFKKWGIATVVTFVLSIIVGAAGAVSIGAFGVLVSFVMTFVVAGTGIHALIEKNRKK